MNILIIEDEYLIQQALKKILEKKGNNVIATDSGRDALEIIKSDKFDRIICDLMLKDITGFDVIEEAKNLFLPSQISSLFILMTAYSSPSVLSRAKSYNCKVLLKPFKSLDEATDIILGRLNEKD